MCIRARARVCVCVCICVGWSDDRSADPHYLPSIPCVQSFVDILLLVIFGRPLQVLLGLYIWSGSKFILVGDKSSPSGSQGDLEARPEKAMHVLLAAAMYATFAIFSASCWAKPKFCCARGKQVTDYDYVPTDSINPG